MKGNLPLRVVFHRVGEPSLEEYGASRNILSSPESAYGFWKTVIETKADFEPDKEHLIVILLDAKLRPTGYHLAALGTLNECNAHPREIFRPAIVSSAYAFIVTHNHPSGDAEPSQADRQLTAKLRDGATLLQINFIDHVIIGTPSPTRQAYFSFRDAGLL